MRYFFGKNMDGIDEFKYFSLAHFIPLIVLGVMIFLLYKFKDKIRNSKHEANYRLAIGIVMIVSEMSYFWRLLHPDLNANVWDHLPITICGWACVFGSIMMFTKNKTLFNINYFWVLALSFNALLTPAVLTSSGPTRYRYYQYWIEHISIYISLFYMIFVHKYRPTWKSFIPATIALVLMATLAISVNSALGTSPEGIVPNGTTTANYLFINTVEDGFSIANLLPKNPFLKYFIIITLVGTLFFLAYLPWFIMDRKKAKRDKIIKESLLIDL